MKEKTFVFTKEMAKLFTMLRKRAGLSQSELAQRIGLSRKSYPYISYLESGKIKNPTLANIVLYVRACGGSLPEFFKELDRIDFKLRHEKMIAQLPKPPEKRKIERDVMKYEINVEFPSKEKEEIDFERLKRQIKEKVKVLLIKNQIEENRFNSYQKFALEYFDFLAALNKAGMKMVSDKYQRGGLKFHLITKIKKIINSVLRGEIKRIEAKKPLPSVKQEKMAIGFTKYRIRIEKIEAEVHKLLCDLSVPTSWFASYKAFARECYKTLKKYYGKNQELLNKNLTEIIKRWQKEGLKEDVLLKLRDKIISVFRTMRLRGEV
jgi:transcriptional regulator with XRE-family HTH domain